MRRHRPLGLVLQAARELAFGCRPPVNGTSPRPRLAPQDEGDWERWKRRGRALMEIDRWSMLSHLAKKLSDKCRDLGASGLHPSRSKGTARRLAGVARTRPAQYRHLPREACRESTPNAAAQWRGQGVTVPTHHGERAPGKAVAADQLRGIPGWRRSCSDLSSRTVRLRHRGAIRDGLSHARHGTFGVERDCPRFG